MSVPATACMPSRVAALTGLVQYCQYSQARQASALGVLPAGVYPYLVSQLAPRHSQAVCCSIALAAAANLLPAGTSSRPRTHERLERGFDAAAAARHGTSMMQQLL